MTHDMTAVVVLFFSCGLFLMNLSYFIGVAKNGNDYYLPLLACLGPSLIFLTLGLILNWFDKSSDFGQIWLTLLIINIVLGLWPTAVMFKINKLAPTTE